MHGSSQKDEHMKLLDKGTKLIILDHHEVSNDMNYGKYAERIALVNSQLDYANPALSGAGVALKFAQAYCTTYGIAFPNKLYGLAACGIVADVMDMSNLENRYIISQGLKYIGEQPFLQGLVAKAHFNQENPIPTIKDIGWVLGPNINSIVRLGTMAQKHIIFTALVSPFQMTLSSKRGAEDEEVPIYEEAIRLCDNAKKRQTTAINKSIKIIESKSKNNHKAFLYIDTDQELTFELSGLIANKILSKTNQPTFLLRRFTDAKGTDEYRGSVRCKSVEGLSNFKELVKGLSGVQMAEGHANSFGVAIDRESLDIFQEHLDEVLKDIDFNANLYIVDLIASYAQLNKSVAQIMSAEDVWSHGVEKPGAVLTDVPAYKASFMGADGQHAKIDCGGFDVVLFNVPDLISKISQGGRFNIDVVGEFEVDKSYNVGRLQLMVKDYEIKAYKEPSIWEYAF